MAPNETEAAAFATTSETDLYEILGISVDAPESALRKAFRRQSLKWHPDKNSSPEAAAKFHLLTTAYDVISDPATKAAYDNARAARLAKKRRSEAFNLHRRQMQQDLEARESSAKRARTMADEEEECFRAQLAQLQEEGAKLRRRREEALRTAAKEAAAEDGSRSDAETNSRMDQPNTASRFSELDRTVLVRWWCKGGGEDIDAARLRELFARFGKVQDCVVRQPKIGPGEKEKKLQTGLVVFDSVVGAHTAVRDALSNKGEGLEVFKSVSWASGKEPDLSGLPTEEKDGVSAATPPSSSKQPPENTSGTSLPESKASGRSEGAWIPPPPSASSKTQANGKQAPSFASFSSAAANRAQQNTSLPFSKSAVAESTDYESITLMRMRDAERRRIESEIRKQESSEAS